MISILLPTRQRVKKLTRWFTAMEIVTGFTEDIEVLIKVDHDDHETQDFLTDLETAFQFKIVPMENKGFLGMTGYLNELASHARGDVLMFASDDIYITTGGWDHLIRNHMVGMGTYKYFHDGMWHNDINPQYISRVWYDTLGFIAPPDCPFADGFMAAVGNKLGLTAETNIVYWRDAEDLKDEGRRILVEGIPLYRIRDEDYAALERLCQSV